MDLPDQIIEVKERLLKEKDPRLQIMKKLTEPFDKTYQSDVVKMWKSLLRAEKDNGGGFNNEWVLEFLDAVHIFRQEKAYFSLPGADRRQYLKDIRKCTKTLKIAYKKLGLDQSFLLYDPAHFPLLDAYKFPITDNHSLPAIGITEALDFYRDYASEQIKSFNPKGKAGERQESNRFVRSLGTRFMNRYKTPLLKAIATAAFLMYGKEYSEPDVLNLVKGRK